MIAEDNQESQPDLLSMSKAELERLYTELMPRVRALGVPALQADDAFDILQDAITVIYTKIKNGQIVITDSPQAYIFGTCKILFSRKYKKKSENRVTEEPFETLLIEDDFDLQKEMLQVERFRLYRDKMLELGERCRQLMMLYLKRVPLTKIKDEMSYASEEAVKQQKFKCKKQLIDSCRRDPRFKSLIIN
jgi:DNA-directed RNA polymerase specialized sigma24 family protein